MALAARDNPPSGLKAQRGRPGVLAMPTLAELINERRAKIDAFHYELYDGRADLDISGLRRAIERTPVNSKADALAALDLILDEAKKREPDLIIQMVIALRKYVETL
jgi:hypothetical protein